MRIGHGFDVHPLDDLPPLKIGGVVVDETRGLGGTSDADVLVHAVADALLGAAALGDLGTYFPSSDERWLGANSLDLLEQVVAMVSSKGWKVSNIDATVMAQTVRVSPHREAMRANIAGALGVDVSDVSVKATTTDELGFLGRDEGVAAMVTVLLIDQ
jgi:2-C-methyl-D-erythritol 2,4-cyclodiphosphate synthase